MILCQWPDSNGVIRFFARMWIRIRIYWMDPDPNTLAGLISDFTDPDPIFLDRYGSDFLNRSGSKYFGCI